jgi:hypothetical protein
MIRFNIEKASPLPGHQQARKIILNGIKSKKMADGDLRYSIKEPGKFPTPYPIIVSMEYYNPEAEEFLQKKGGIGCLVDCKNISEKEA